MYLPDTNIVSELRRPRPHRGVLNWIEEAPSDRLFLSAVTVGEIQAGIEITREQDEAKAKELETWLDRIVSGYGVLPMDAAAFREWARLKHRKSDTLIEGRHDRDDGESAPIDGGDEERSRLPGIRCGVVRFPSIANERGRAGERTTKISPIPLGERCTGCKRG